MANRRMFSKTITNSSRFLMMPLSAQALYFHLGMNADDDGFVEHFSIMRMIEAKPDDLKVLQAKGFVKVFDENVLIILDWKENNYLRSDRYKPSKYLKIYKKELKKLASEQEKIDYGNQKSTTPDTVGIPSGIPSGIPLVTIWDTQVRIGKDSIGKDRIEIGKDNKVCSNSIVSKNISSSKDNKVCSNSIVSKDSSKVKPISKEKEKYKKEKEKKSISPDQFKPDWMADDDWKDLIEHRRKVKAMNTPRALSVLFRELNKARDNGWTGKNIVDEIINRGWKGFKAEWLENAQVNRSLSYAERISEGNRKAMQEFIEEG